ncbi:DUF3347 domain-containing protein [Cytophagaceae bacterium 50C-KIRBA]|uniref:DUF3347 domain-containing protein n=1 Tax=Aquirufa beregesia TaxID=2516556 RepID=A0ABX0EX69_9BACT|nr:DUF3347 domain-containing protein [Aquirufa beregesia]NGZ45175.1 DUF3347 domain-containing protein [Aquirufa beregesia]
MMKSTKLLMATAILLFAFNLSAQTNSNITKVFNSYIALKDALVKTDGVNASVLAKDLLTSIDAVKMNELDVTTHTQWMKVVNELIEDAEHINETKEISHQRDHFMTLSKNLYSIIKVSKIGTPVFYQFCPMANKGKGANWLSVENKIKNPYYGNQMLSCGRVVETIQ